jgi:polysaccharide biosynthesis/export protein
MNFQSSTTRSHLLLSVFLTLAAPVWAQTPAPYVLHPGDVVELKFFYNPELNENVQIRPDGQIALALIGEVKISGKTPGQVTEELQALYRPIVKNPRIVLQVRSFAGQRVYVGGEVTRPGTVTLIDQQTVLDAIMESGGLKHTSGDYLLLIRRGDVGKPFMQRVSLRNQNNLPSEASQMRLQPFDVLLVPESKIARVDRWVDQFLRQTNPASLNAGFSYLLGGTVALP